MFAGGLNGSYKHSKPRRIERFRNDAASSDSFESSDYFVSPVDSSQLSSCSCARIFSASRWQARYTEEKWSCSLIECIVLHSKFLFAKLTNCSSESRCLHHSKRASQGQFGKSWRNSLSLSATNFPCHSRNRPQNSKRVDSFFSACKLAKPTAQSKTSVAVDEIDRLTKRAVK